MKSFLAHDLKEQAVPSGKNQRSAGIWKNAWSNTGWSSIPQIKQRRYGLRGVCQLLVDALSMEGQRQPKKLAFHHPRVDDLHWHELKTIRKDEYPKLDGYRTGTTRIPVKENNMLEEAGDAKPAGWDPRFTRPTARSSVQIPTIPDSVQGAGDEDGNTRTKVREFTHFYIESSQGSQDVADSDELVSSTTLPTSDIQEDQSNPHQKEKEMER
ncbi:hypothetical protein C2845_PM06G34040 [Panicum miliaceum]|uniref:Uncharacterized protein n=1 Tax=Panicum miliaceum TaxID=4540 RepID=A0A3L6RAX0_PANMI|nr:hypothetical protein C2845_PM06G34040 [Panicum miliaceum]